jgi:putative ABC transport system ATP-binding protein
VGDAPLFALEEVSVARGGAAVLDGLSLVLDEGSTCVAGPSGAGKSTLLRLLNRLREPDAGRVLYRDVDVRERDVLALRREVSLIPQLPALLEGTVAENVAYGARLAGRTADVVESLVLAGLDAAYAERDAGRLSVGEQQRVMLARALALEPQVLLLDEPTSALDERAQTAVEGTLLDLREHAGVSMVLVTHDLDQARRLADRVLWLEHGRLLPVADRAGA